MKNGINWTKTKWTGYGGAHLQGGGTRLEASAIDQVHVQDQCGLHPTPSQETKFVKTPNQQNKLSYREEYYFRDSKVASWVKMHDTVPETHMGKGKNNLPKMSPEVHVCVIEIPYICTFTKHK